jgi:hypothetical protein
MSLFGWLLTCLSGLVFATVALLGLAWAAGVVGDAVVNRPVKVCPGWERVRGPN